MNGEEKGEETFLDEAAQLIECFRCRRRWFIFTLHALHTGSFMLVKCLYHTMDVQQPRHCRPPVIV